MRVSTYRKMEQLCRRRRGYISTGELEKEGFTNRQIALLTGEGYLEKVCFGYYWLQRCACDKPRDYKCIEVCLSNPRAVIAMRSACYYQGVGQEEPAAVSVATERTDRSKMKLNFPVERHYFSGSIFSFGIRRIQTQFGGYNIYEVERSFCDRMRLDRSGADCGLTAEICDYIEAEHAQRARILKYAELLRVGKALARHCEIDDGFCTCCAGPTKEGTGRNRDDSSRSVW